MMRFQKKSPVAEPFRYPEQLVGELAAERWPAARSVDEP